ncbi:Cys/Met metabolism PLP-dependent enzyme-domain-containing protein [Hysterangium stoloniferum]|nr:Cys/Met metabolism PLP-dependent enzyme-domain-containing protein [Hysterangium stoloniferum]
MSPHVIQGINGLNGHHTSNRFTSVNGIQHPIKSIADEFSTRAIHVGSEPSNDTGAVIPPISLSTTYKQDAVGVHKGFEYTRSQNPNREAFERMLAALEDNGGKALAFASGSAATASMLQSIGSGAHVLSINDVYGGTFRYLSKVASQLQGIEATFLDFDKASDDDVINAIRPNTKLVWIETPTNPTLRLPNIPHLTSLIRNAFPRATRPLIAVDSTFLSPFFISPLAAPIHADIALHSVTKYINGHSDVLMGTLILPRSEGNDTIDSLYQKLQFIQNAHGAVPGAFDAWLAMRGAKTLALRMKEHARNAVKLARALKRNKNVKTVIYPGLREHPGNSVARKLLSTHARKFVEEWERADTNVERAGDFPFGGMVSFRIEGDDGAAERFLMKTRLFTLAESLGGVESLAEVPEKMTHGSIPPAERAALGITADLVRLSVGVEDRDDLIADVEQALEWAVTGYKHESNGY